MPSLQTLLNRRPGKTDADIRTIRQTLHPLAGTSTDYDSLLDWIGDARLVLLGEASHGTSEF